MTTATLGLDQALTSVPSTGESIVQALMIVMVLTFLVWNVKLALEEIN